MTTDTSGYSTEQKTEQVSPCSDNCQCSRASSIVQAYSQPGCVIDQRPNFQKRLIQVSLAALLAGVGIIGRKSGLSDTIAFIFLAAGVVLAGRTIFIKGLLSARMFSPDMNFLMLVAACGGIAIGEWVEGTAIVILFAIAELIEDATINRSKGAIRALIKLAPQTASIIKNGKITEIPVEQVNLGDHILVRPGFTIPVDGEIIDGISSVNQASITGESLPIPRMRGDRVLATSINGDGALTVKVISIPGDTTFDRIIRLVEQAQKERPRVQTFIERFARIYTPSVIGIAIMIASIPPLFFGAEWGVWIYRSLAMLLISCPCAFVISTPVTVASALTGAARRGVLIKGGTHLDMIRRAAVFALDKTGTVTDGELAINEIHTVNARTPDEVVSTAASVEAHSEHPIARAISQYADMKEVSYIHPTHFVSYPGRGASAHVGDEKIFVGNHELFEETGICDETIHPVLDKITLRGQTPVMIGSERQINGILTVSDKLRDHTADVVRRLSNSGARIFLLTGDNRAAAAIIGKAAGIEEIYADLLPEQKVSTIKNLRARFGSVVMVGDGVNDAPALAAADVGIAMGGIGSDAALETADIVLMSDRIDRLPWLLRLSQKTHRIILANILAAIGIKLAFLGMAAAGHATLWMAITADMGVSLLVIFNGLRALRCK